LGSGRPLKNVAQIRRNRVVVMLTDTEFEKLEHLAAQRELPVGTTAYAIFAPALKRARS